MGKQTESNMGAVNLIASTTVIKGDIVTDSDIRIDGKLEGSLQSKGRLIIGQTGSIHGEITCRSAEIEGIADGKITVAELLSLKTTSKLHGEVVTGQLMIEPGAHFTGQCKMNTTTGEKSK
jgi:cytoskeletal protein CcmA (bactofilin family)